MQCPSSINSNPSQVTTRTPRHSLKPKGYLHVTQSSDSLREEYKNDAEHTLDDSLAINSSHILKHVVVSSDDDNGDDNDDNNNNDDDPISQLDVDVSSRSPQKPCSGGARRTPTIVKRELISNFHLLRYI